NFFFSSRRRHTRWPRDWSSDVCSSDLVSGFVAIWLPEELVMLYLRHGELVNATVRDARGSQAVSLARALDKVPAEPEYGEISFKIGRASCRERVKEGGVAES